MFRKATALPFLLITAIAMAQQSADVRAQVSSEPQADSVRAAIERAEQTLLFLMKAEDELVNRLDTIDKEIIFKSDQLDALISKFNKTGNTKLLPDIQALEDEVKKLIELEEETLDDLREVRTAIERTREMIQRLRSLLVRMTG